MKTNANFKPENTLAEAMNVRGTRLQECQTFIKELIYKSESIQRNIHFDLKQIFEFVDQPEELAFVVYLYSIAMGTMHPMFKEYRDPASFEKAIELNEDAQTVEAMFGITDKRKDELISILSKETALILTGESNIKKSMFSMLKETKSMNECLILMYLFGVGTHEFKFGK